MKEYTDYSLLRHNTFGIDARCRRFLEVDSVEELQAFAVSWHPETDGALMVIGAGSNLLLTKDYPGTVLHVAPPTPLKEGMKGQGGASVNRLVVGAGETWDNVVAYTVDHGLYGAENLSLIPGEVGAAAVQNIGAYGVEVKDLIERVEAVELRTGHVVSFSCDECGYGYRYSHFKGKWAGRYVITSVTFRLSTTFEPHLGYGNIRAELERQGISQPTAKQLRNTIIAIRRNKLPDPERIGNAGSFFMNPVVSRQQFLQLLEDYPQMPHYRVDDDHEKIPAAWLIEQCGWKGRSLGPAGVYEHQPLVLVNRGGATGADIVKLCQAIQADVSHKFGINIKPEVNIQ